MNLTAATQVTIVPRTKSATVRIWETGTSDNDDISSAFNEGGVGFSILGYGNLRRDKAISMDQLIL